MADKAGRTTHFYPLSMLTYPICPPPRQVRACPSPHTLSRCALHAQSAGRALTRLASDGSGFMCTALCFQVGGAVGEERTVKWSPAGLHFGEAIDLDEFAQGCVVDDFPEGCEQSPRDALRDKLSEHIHGVVSANYGGLEEKLREFL